ncbi:MAG: hypothetical protein LBD23_09010 [Oscillospiraceae bacterium]|jgi:hypothetical protein|nr:hypothetical protein [Oscillospiraceae bacterium]
MAYIPIHRVEVRVLAVGQGSSNVICGYHTYEGIEYLSFLLINDFGGGADGGRGAVYASLAEVVELMEKRAKDEKFLLSIGHNQLDLADTERFFYTYLLDSFVLSHPDADHYKVFARRFIYGKNTVGFKTNRTTDVDFVFFQENDYSFFYSKSKYQHCFSQSRLLAERTTIDEEDGSEEIDEKIISFHKEITNKRTYCVLTFRFFGEIIYRFEYTSKKKLLSDDSMHISLDNLDYIYDQENNSIRITIHEEKKIDIDVPPIRNEKDFFEDVLCNVFIRLERHFAGYIEIAEYWTEHYKEFLVDIEDKQISNEISKRKTASGNADSFALANLWHPLYFYANKKEKHAALSLLVDCANHKNTLWTSVQSISADNLLLELIPFPYLVQRNLDRGEKKTVLSTSAPDDGNLYSMALTLRLDIDKLFVFPGDITSMGMFYFIMSEDHKRMIANATVFTAPHHGSSVSSQGTYTVDKEPPISVLESYLNQINTQHHIISAGLHNGHKHPCHIYIQATDNANTKLGDNSRLQAVPAHEIYFYNENDAIRPEVRRTALYTTIGKVILENDITSISFLYEMDYREHPHTFASYAYAPNNVEDKTKISDLNTIRPLLSPTNFTLEHRGGALWQ